MTPETENSVLLIGATGYLGSLVAAGLLCEGYKIVAPIRQSHTRENFIDKLKLDLAAEEINADIDFDRLTTISLPPVAEIPQLKAELSALGVNEIIHCAGSVDYFDTEKLKEVNIDLTNSLLALGKQLEIKRFVYLSTAFSSGFIDGLVREILHQQEPNADPTEYTKSKRQAEALVSNSGIPFLIVRPSVVIGDSRKGHYNGKPYGLYQFWAAFEKFICGHSRNVLHFMAPAVKLHLIHQDAFKAGFIAACKDLPDNSVVHLTSCHETLPTVAEVVKQWSSIWNVKEVHLYKDASEIPATGIDRRNKMWLDFTAVNNDIAAHHWQFQTASLDKLRKTGLKFKDVTLDTVRVCQDHFVAHSQRAQDFLKKNKEELTAAATKAANSILLTK
jgi:nucleoside-diphosphate-sugar epimerase